MQTGYTNLPNAAPSTRKFAAPIGYPGWQLFAVAKRKYWRYRQGLGFCIALGAALFAFLIAISVKLTNMIKILRKAKSITLFKYVLGLGICSTLQPALASLPPEEYHCSPSVKVSALRGMPAKSREKALRKLLLESEYPPCIGWQMFPKDGSSGGLSILAKLMLSDSSADVRANAASALGEVVAGRKAALEALGARLDEEDNAQVAQQRIESIERQLEQIGTTGWDRTISLSDIFDWLKSVNNNPARTPEEKEILRFAVGRLVGTVGTRLTWTQDRHFSTEEIGDIWQQLSGQLSELLIREPGVHITDDDWRDTPLSVLANALESKTVGIEHGLRAASLMHDAAKGMDDPHPTVHRGSLHLMSAMLELLARSSEPGWRDFAPHLAWRDTMQLTRVAVSALTDEEPSVRAEALHLLGLLAVGNAKFSDELLVAALRDNSYMDAPSLPGIFSS